MMRVAIADDEPLARALLARQLSPHSVTIVAECGSSDALREVLHDGPLDVVFVDVEMPGPDVFSILEARALQDPATCPAVVFVTAYEKYAVRAFDLHAADYLVKPVAPARLADALNRVRARTDAAHRAAGLVSLARDLGTEPRRLLVQSHGRLVPIDIEQVDWIAGEDDFARLYVGGRQFLVSRTLRDLERRLTGHGFQRIHRSAIVNVARVVEVRGETGGRYAITLRDGTRLVVGRTHAHFVREWKL